MNATPQTPAAHAIARSHDGPRGGIARLLGFGLLIGALGFFAGRTLAHDGGFGDRFFGGDPVQAEARIEKMVKHLAVEVDATPAQQEKLAQTARAAAKDIAPLRAKMREHRERALALLAEPEFDRGRIEALRAEQMADADALSRRIAQAVADAAEVLSAEQRQKLAAHIAERRARHGGHHGGHGGGHGPWSQMSDGPGPHG